MFRNVDKPSQNPKVKVHVMGHNPKALPTVHLPKKPRPKILHVVENLWRSPPHEGSSLVLP
jgi:hypothetical protein